MLEPKKLLFLCWQQDSVQASSRKPWLGVCLWHIQPELSCLASQKHLWGTQEWAQLMSCTCSLLFSHLVLPPRSSAPGVLERSHTLVPADTTKVRQEGCETCPGGWTGLCQPSLCLVFPSLFAVLWFKIVEMMLCSRFFELINVHDLLMFWEPTTWCSSFKRLEYFVLKKRREKHFPLKLRLQN